MTLAVLVHPDADSLAEAAGTRLLLALHDAQAERSPVHVALTGGSTGIAMLAAASRSPLRDLVDWTDVHLWWGDERFVARDSSDRNARQAHDALLSQVPVPDDHIHPMPAADDVADAETGALAYAHEMARVFGTPAGVFDVVLLGMGPDGHVASLFPGHPAQLTGGAPTVAVHDSPKPPSDRISLTFEALNRARDVWFVVNGADKAWAVAYAFEPGADRGTVSAAGVRGQERTLWLVDLAAASALPTNADT